MGKRSRQKQSEASQRKREQPTEHKAKRRQYRERADAASRVAEAKIKERPKAPWDPFPLMELAIFSGLVMLVIGAIVGDNIGRGLMASGLVLACIGGLDTVFREQFNGYRPHSGLIAGLAALAALIGTTAIASIGIVPRAAIAIGVFGLLFPVLRRDFIRRSNGRGVL